MRLFCFVRGESGQATVETLALVPFVISAAIGLCAVGLWFEQRQASGAQLSDATVRWLESGTSDRGNGKVRVKVTNGVAEAVSSSGRGSLLGVSLTGGERLKWVEVGP